ncbi:MAG: sensor histidine kinase, partial [Deltaproteobacteria bacterium]|nr:sensor histidine kinase [Deltaproteobacteria bacterium]
KIEAQRGRILFHPPPPGHADRPDDDTGAALCALRGGMFEAIPMLFGLVPARVREKACAYRGAAACEFEVSWTRTPRIGLMGGLLAGGLIGAALILLGPGWGLPLWSLGLAGPSLAVICAAAGRSLDLARQLEAVAGARRGQLALLDQLDTSLAERMDELAKLDPRADSTAGAAGEDGQSDAIQGLVPVLREAGEDGDRHLLESATAETRTTILAAARALRDELAQLHERISNQGSPADAAVQASVRSCAAHGRHIEAAVGELERRLVAGETTREACEPRALLQRALEGLRPELPPDLRVEADLDADLPLIHCDTFQIEHVIEQLLRNAAEAVSGSGHVRLSLAASPGGVEIAVEDNGAGIEHHTVDEVFDPFMAGGPVGQRGGLGLTVCYRIVEEHGGELHVRSSAETGTRVSIVLPTNT